MVFGPQVQYGNRLVSIARNWWYRDWPNEVLNSEVFFIRVDLWAVGKGIDGLEANAETPDDVRNHPALQGVSIPRTGRSANTIGILITKSLMIAGEPGTFTMPDGRIGAMLRAYDKKTGMETGAVYMPAGQTGTPMTYVRDGRQYIVIAIAGNNYSAELLAFRLP